jgi:hypothetical protein
MNDNELFYNPESLPDIDSVEIIIFHANNCVSNIKIISDSSAIKIADLFRNLPPGEQARCHLPPFGLRFYIHEILLLECSICWICNNIHIQIDGKKKVYTFDGNHHISQNLLMTLQELTGVIINPENF